jgi:hypothetical protein
MLIRTRAIRVRPELSETGISVGLQCSVRCKAEAANA